MPSGTVGGTAKPVHVQVHLSWAEDESTALSIAHDQWRTNVFGSELMWDLELPMQFDAAAQHVQPQDVCGRVLGVRRPRTARQLDR